MNDRSGEDDEMPSEIDFSKGVRGKYNNLLAKGTNVAIIDPALHPAPRIRIP